MFNRIFKKKYSPEEWDIEKSRGMEHVLGKEHDLVMHALIPYAVGGGLDLYYFPNKLSGTAIATKELIRENGKGNKNREHKAYELVMFTKEELNIDDAKNEETVFGKVHKSINGIMNVVARYGGQTELNPHETCEFPEDMDLVGGKCLVFDSYEPEGRKFEIFGQNYGLLLLMEVHRSEMEYAREHGTESLNERLKDNGHYPYSDLNRQPVI